MNTAKMTADLISRGIRQVKIAAYCGVHQSTVSRWLKGLDPEGPSRDLLSKLYRETFGEDSLSEFDAADETALRQRLIAKFDQIRDRKMKLVALRQLEALADQADAGPPTTGADQDEGRPT